MVKSKVMYRFIMSYPRKKDRLTFSEAVIARNKTSTTLTKQGSFGRLYLSNLRLCLKGKNINEVKEVIRGSW